MAKRTFITSFIIFFLSIHVHAQSYKKLMERGDSAVAAYNLKQAIDSYEAAMKKKPKYSEPMVKLADCYYRRAAYGKALMLINQASALTDDSLSHEAMREAFYSCQKLSDAQSQLYWGNQLLSRFPMDGEVVAAMADVYFDDNTFDAAKAIALTSGYLAKDSSNISVLQRNALAHQYAKDYVVAAEKYQQLIALGDSTKDTYYRAGLNAYYQNDYKKGKDYLEKAVQLDHFKNATYLYYLGSLSCLAKEYDEAEKYLLMAKKKYEPDKTVTYIIHQYLGDTYYAKKKNLKAIEAYRQALATRYEKVDPELFYKLSVAYELEGDKENKNIYREKYNEIMNPR